MAYPATTNDLSTYMDDIGGTNTTAFPLSPNRYRAFDRGMQNLTAEIMDAMSNANFQGEQSTHDLITNQREYLFPTDLLKIKRIDVTFDGTNWVQAREIDPSQVNEFAYASETMIVNRFDNKQPYFYFLENSFVILSGSIATTITNGIKLTYGKQIVGQDASNNDLQNFANTTDVPNLPEFAKMWLVFWALLEFYDNAQNTIQVAKWNNKLYGNPQGRPADQQKIGGLLKKIINYYTSKDPDQAINLQMIYQEEDFN